VLHWPAGAKAKGALLTGDIIYRGAGSPLRELHAQLSKSIPLGTAAIRRIVERIEPFLFDQFTADGGKRTFFQMQKERCDAQPNVISGRSASKRTCETIKQVPIWRAIINGTLLVRVGLVFYSKPNLSLIFASSSGSQSATDAVPTISALRD